MSYTIRPLKQAELTAPLGVLAMMGDMRSFVVAPVFVFYLENTGSKKKILVDAGVAAPSEEGGTVHGFPIKGGGEEGLRSALEEVKTTPEEIDTLILTHLHFDHSACISSFKNARIYLQMREWETAFNPVPSSRAAYDRDLFEGLEKMDLVLVNGDYQLEDGLKLLFLPGHTQGLQGVALSTGKGTAVLTGDLCYCYFNLNPDMAEMVDLAGNKVELNPRPDLPFMANGIHVDLTEWFDSMWKVVRIASSRDMIYPGHDPSLVGRVLP